MKSSANLTRFSLSSNINIALRSTVQSTDFFLQFLNVQQQSTVTANKIEIEMNNIILSKLNMLLKRTVLI